MAWRTGAIATLFDFNGVLVDDESVHFESFHEVAQPLGIVLDAETYSARYLGFDDAGAFRAMIVDAGRTPTSEDLARLVDAKKPIYMRRIATGLVVFDGAVELVRRRAQLGPVGIVSGALRHEIEHILGLMGVRAQIAFIVSAEDVKACKPDPAGYLLGLQTLGLDLDREPRDGIVVLEDSLGGVEAAKQAGLRCVGVASSYPAARLRDAGADAVVERLSELADALFDGKTS